MMNLSELLTSIKMDIGIYGLALPFPDPEKTLYDVLKLKSIKTFSIFAPYAFRMDMDLNKMNSIKKDYNESIYQLPDVFGDRRLIKIRRVEPNNKLLGQGYLDPYFADQFDVSEAMILGQANADLYSYAVPSYTFQFEHPNLLHLYNISSMANLVTIEFCLEHAENLSTIPNTSWNSFYELAVLDIKKFLFNIVKHYRNLQTAYGQIALQIDDWENADADRKELLNEWKDMYHIDDEQFNLI